MKTAILTIGTEILFGQIVNTNAAYLSSELQNLGYDVMYHYTVGDNPKRLKETLEHAFRDCDLIITTGGLGPTQDDLTKETIAEYFGDKVEERPECMKYLIETYQKRGYNLTPNNLKQAYMPTTAEVLFNDAGTAPGFMMSQKGKMIMSLPGPPREVKNMFEKEVKPRLEKMQDSVIYYKLIRTFEYGESLMETDLLPLINGQTDPTIATYAKEGECYLRVASKRPTKEEAIKAVDDMIVKIDELIGQHIYSHDNEDLVEVVGKLLINKHITISSAESCTAGLFAATLGNISGISSVLEKGIVTYTEKAKMEELGVKKETLEQFSAVSEQTALEMVQGLRKKSGSDFCISVTGYSEPGTGTEKDPAGTCYIGVSYAGREYVVRSSRRSVNRNWNRNYAVLKMLYEVYKNIK